MLRGQYHHRDIFSQWMDLVYGSFLQYLILKVKGNYFSQFTHLGTYSFVPYIIVDFVHQEMAGIVIITNKIVSDLELQIIERYIKNVNSIEAEGVNVP